MRARTEASTRVISLSVNIGKRSVLIAVISTVILACFIAPPEVRAQGQPDIVWSSASGASVTSVAYAPDGRTVFSGQGFSGTVEKAGNL